MFQKLKSVSLSVLFAAVLLFGVHWVLPTAAVSSEQSALVGANTCSGAQCQGQGTITAPNAYTVYLPLLDRNYPIPQEFRGLWVTRFDWTQFGHTVSPGDLDRIVDHAASAHFNVLLFQVRGTADAYYSSTLEPWAARLTGTTTKTLGADPGFDPLAYMISRAHQNGLQVHAYMNVYPAWLCDRVGPITSTVPQHPFWQWTYASPDSNRIFRWREWSNGNSPVPMNLIPYNEKDGTCGGAKFLDGYLWASPANPIVQAHILSVAVDLATRYEIDGLHLDLVRYSGQSYSSDPATMRAFSEALAISPTLSFDTWQPQFQRDQVSGLVARIYSATTAIRPELLLSAAVWPNYSSGYNSYYQDSKGWLANGIIDANLPMLYSSDILNDLPAWTSRAQGFIDGAHGRYVFPGISANYTDVTQIVNRIEAARTLGAKGVALFSYGALNTYDYWDDLANGPFAITATVPKPGWKP